jgi:pimeloyl-ACP methyl ester carboxylesterase
MNRRYNSVMQLLSRFACVFAALAIVSCANFRKLGRDLAILDNEYRITGIIENADEQGHPVRVAVIEWDRASNKVFAADTLILDAGGAFGFIVKNPRNQYLTAFADADGNGRHTLGEPWWMHEDAAGTPQPASLGPNMRSFHVNGRLDSSRPAPAAELRRAIDDALQGRKVSDFVTRQGVRFALGEIGKLDDPRFSASRGEDGLWTPATFAVQDGFGVYFLDPYDPEKIPVLFVHGAAGSPQDWRLAMERIDRGRYQPWFYVYPSGMRLDNAAKALDEGIHYLHLRYKFERLGVVAHSMGGLVSRRFILYHLKRPDAVRIPVFITFSTPWDGHEAAAMGVRHAPEVVPSWRDMAAGSGFLDRLFTDSLKGRVNHHLFYSHRASRSIILPAENDGTVSVASQLRSEARADAVGVRGFDEDHVSILTARAPLRAAREILDAGARD